MQVITRTLIALTGIAVLASGGCAMPGMPAKAPASPSAATASNGPSASTQSTEQGDGSASSPIQKVVAAVKPQMEALKKSMGSTYDNITVSAEGEDTLVFEYTFTKNLDKDAMGKAMDKQVPTLQSTSKATVFPAMQSAGVTNPKVRYRYLNRNGDLVWTKVFSAS